MLGSTFVDWLRAARCAAAPKTDQTTSKADLRPGLPEAGDLSAREARTLKGVVAGATAGALAIARRLRACFDGARY
jgi:hypothetical protein